MATSFIFLGFRSRGCHAGGSRGLPRRLRIRGDWAIQGRTLRQSFPFFFFFWSLPSHSLPFFLSLSLSLSFSLFLSLFFLFMTAAIFINERERRMNVEAEKSAELVAVTPPSPPFASYHTKLSHRSMEFRHKKIQRQDRGKEKEKNKKEKKEEETKWKKKKEREREMCRKGTWFKKLPVVFYWLYLFSCSVYSERSGRVPSLSLSLGYGRGKIFMLNFYGIESESLSNYLE